ncbi:ORF918 [White spot syndrome virus]|uniref:ORF918 n=1 Tax=White spot syndrome virus TaxID=342409 RepID=A0A2D3I6P3_9VIRU|nr:ORF918 [White spot syndrome virus]
MARSNSFFGHIFIFPFRVGVVKVPSGTSHSLLHNFSPYVTRDIFFNIYYPVLTPKIGSKFVQFRFWYT